MTGGVTWLLEKLALGEDSTIEFKERITNRDSVAAEISAFANGRGGTLVVGVSDSGQITGVDDIVEAERKTIEICNDSIEPGVHIFTEKLKLEGKSILLVEIPRSLFTHKATNRYFIRQGSSKREMSPEQLGRLMQSRSQARIISFDEQFVPNTDKTILQNDLYERFIGETGTEEQTLDLLRKRRLLVDDNGVWRVSVAALLMCTDRSDDYLYNSFISGVCYTGPHKDANYQLDAKDFKGPLDQQILDAYKFVEKYNEVSARKNIGRQERAQYSMKAVFEALVNAVVHRDYAKHGSKIRLFMFSDRLELYSPGALANTLTVDTLLYNQITRNELLARLLSELQIDNDTLGKEVGRRYFLERRGEGVGIILRESERFSGKTPSYVMHNEELCLIVYAADSLQET